MKTLPRSEPSGATAPSPTERETSAPGLSIAMVAACPYPYPRGTPIRIRGLANALAKRGHSVHVVTYHLGDGGEGDWEADPVSVHRIRNVATYRKYAPGPSYQKLAILDPLLSRKVSGVCKRHGAEVIHAHHYEGLLASVMARMSSGAPLVYDAHTLLSSELPYYRLGLPALVKQHAGSALDRWLPRLSNHVVSVTDRIREKLVGESGLAAEDVTVISNGVEVDLFGGKNGADRKGPVKTLIFTGNLAPYQGIELMLQAFSRIRKERDDVRLLIASESSFEPYERMARELGIRKAVHLEAVGFERIPDLLREADVALNPRERCDGIPMKLLNYMAASKPVVSFALSAPGVRHEETGWLVQPGMVSDFAKGALTLLGDERLAAEIGRNARQHVVSHHSWEAKAREAEGVYRRLLDRKGAPESSAQRSVAP